MYVYAVFLDLCHFGAQNSEKGQIQKIYIVSTTVLADTRLIMKKEESVKSFGTPSSLILVALNVLVLL